MLDVFPNFHAHDRSHPPHAGLFNVLCWPTTQSTAMIVTYKYVFLPVNQSSNSRISRLSQASTPDTRRPASPNLPGLWRKPQFYLMNTAKFVDDIRQSAKYWQNVPLFPIAHRYYRRFLWFDPLWENGAAAYCSFRFSLCRGQPLFHSVMIVYFYEWHSVGTFWWECRRSSQFPEIKIRKGLLLIVFIQLVD